MKRLMLLAFLSAGVSPAHAAWEAVEGGAMSRPVETNSTIEAVLVHCVESAVLEVYSPQAGPVLPADKNAEADYFYKPEAVRAEIDGRFFPLAAAGSDQAVVLFSQGVEAESYLAPLDPALIEALKTGRSLTLAFDITSASAADGSGYETFARFDLAGAADLIGTATSACQ